MYKIIKIDDDFVFVGKSDDRQFTKIPKKSFGFEPNVGDYVEFFKSDSEYIISKIDPLEQFTNHSTGGVIKGQSQKSKIIAGILALFDSLGFYHFYIGKTGVGLLRLVITIIGLFPWLLPIAFLVNSIFNLVMMLLVLTSKPGNKWHQDANGLELQD